MKNTILLISLALTCIININFGAPNPYKTQSISISSSKNASGYNDANLTHKKTKTKSNSFPNSCGIVPSINISPMQSTDYNGALISSYGQIPWQVGIFTQKTFMCSGVLISNSHVITAAICVYGLEDFLDSVELRLGDWDISENVNNLYEPYQYYSSVPSSVNMIPDSALLAKDVNPLRASKIAILTLKYPVNNLLYPHIRPICLPLKKNSDPPEQAIVSGWGPQSPNNNFEIPDQNSFLESTLSLSDIKLYLQEKNKRLQKVSSDHGPEQMLHDKLSFWGNINNGFDEENSESQHGIVRSPNENATSPISSANDSAQEIIYAHPEPNPISFSLPVLQLSNQQALYHSLNPNDLLNSSEIFTESEKDLENPKYEILNNSSFLLDPLNHHELPDELLFSKTNTSMVVSAGNQSVEINTGRPEDIHRRQEESQEEIGLLEPVFMENYPVEDDIMFRHKQKYKYGKQKGAQGKQVPSSNNNNRNQKQSHAYEQSSEESKESEKLKRETGLFPLPWAWAYPTKPSYSAILKWTSVKYYKKCPNFNHEITSADIQFGSGCIVPNDSDSSKSFCLIDIGSPVIKLTEFSEDMKRAKNERFTLIGMVTWKKPCPSRMKMSMRMLDYEADTEAEPMLTSSVTVVIDILDFISEIRAIINEVN